MATITAIEPDRRHRGRVTVFVDGRPTISLSRRGLQEFGLRGGEEIDEATLEKRAGVAERAAAHSSALDLLARQAHSAREVGRRLTGRGFSEPVVVAEVERLKRAGLLDDERFAADYVDNRLAARPAGRRLLRSELIRRGVGREAVEAAIARSPQGGSPEELALARRCVQERLGRRGAAAGAVGREAGAKVKRQLLDHLLRRGFTYETAERVARESIPADRAEGEEE